MSRTPAILFGTRPEAIKLAPVIHELQARGRSPVIVQVQQHQHLVKSVLEFFDIRPTFVIPMQATTLARRLAELVERLSYTFPQPRRLCPVVQGDTLTVLGTALWSFYGHTPLVHVEAGLRSRSLMHPWPEEMHRRVVTLCATHHCVPTRQAYKQLLFDEKVAAALTHTGNTVVDAVEYVLQRAAGSESDYEEPWFQGGGKTVLVTGHRRENIDKTLEAVARVMCDLVREREDARVVWVKHPNPAVQKAVERGIVTDVPPEVAQKIWYVEPMSYPQFVHTMQRAHLIVSDSGGVQEEACVVGTPVLITRRVTERPEAIGAGYAKLAGTSYRAIRRSVLQTYDGEILFQKGTNPFVGPNGTPAKDVVDAIDGACQ